MRNRHRRDNNHAEVKAAFEKLGCGVLDISQVGNGAPDLIVTCQRTLRFVECKDVGGVLSADQMAFPGRIKAPVYIVRSPETAHALVEHWRLGRGEVEIA